jgi:DNA-binding winged helix-turn-helix (wHTH) protein
MSRDGITIGSADCDCAAATCKCTESDLRVIFKSSAKLFIRGNLLMMADSDKLSEYLKFASETLEMAAKNLRFQLFPRAERVRFGPFELDPRAGELRKHGIRLKLKQQPLQILLMLVERPGEVVLREEIREKLWPNDTIVEFDHSINAAVQKLRDALGESAAEPRYIETLPKRGYRFIATVEAPPLGEKAHSEGVVRAEIDKPLVLPPPVHRRRPWLWISAAAALTVVVLGEWMILSGLREPARSITLSLGAVGNAVVSPDGSAVVYNSSRGLMLRRLDSLEEFPIYTDNRLGDNPVWSPDGSQVLFRTFADLTRVPLSKGPPVKVWPQLGVTRGYAWARDGSVTVSTLNGSRGAGLWLVLASGGDPVRVEVPGLSEGRFLYPEFLPDGKTILFGFGRDSDTSLEIGLYLATLDHGRITKDPFLLRKNLTVGHYSPSGGGKLMFLQNDKLYAQGLDVGRGRLKGEPEQVVDGVLSSIMTQYPAFSVSRNGVLVWEAGRAGVAELTWFDRTGKVLGTVGPPCLPDTVQLSPDGKHVLALAVGDPGGYSIVEPNRSGYVSLGVGELPLWMPDSSHILYPRKKDNMYSLVERAAEGGAERELARLPVLPSPARLRDISPDGKVALYKVAQTIYSIRLDDPGERIKPEVVAPSTRAGLSPDGRWIVYNTTRNDRTEVYAQPFPSGGLPVQISSGGGTNAVWRGDGKEILYRNDSTIYSVRVEIRGNAIHASPAEALFNVRVPAGIVGDSMPMAVTRDGSRILFAQGVEQPNPQLTYVMTSWDHGRQ